MNYKLWDKKSSINGVEASYFLNKEPFKSNSGDIILIFNDSGKVSNVESKQVLAKIYEIDETLPIDDFMNAYEEKLNEVNKEVEDNETLWKHTTI